MKQDSIGKQGAAQTALTEEQKQQLALKQQLHAEWLANPTTQELIKVLHTHEAMLIGNENSNPSDVVSAVRTVRAVRAIVKTFEHFNNLASNYNNIK